MPSDDRTRLALEAIAAPTRAFWAALRATSDEVRRYLTTCQATWEARVALAAAELGPLAAGRVDPARFAEQFFEPGATDAGAVGTIEWALATLDDLVARGDALLHVGVPSGGSLYGVVAKALTDVGAGFAAARAVSRTRAGGSWSGQHAADGPLPFAQWSRNERLLAPPLVVDVAGGDLRAAALAEFMDGRQRIILVVDGECPPAALARLIAPGTFVLQSQDGFDLDRLVAWQGPGIAALVPEGAAQFVHDPGAKERLQIRGLPERPPRRPIAGLSVAQQLEELDLLRSLTSRAGGPPSAAAEGDSATAAAADPADRLANWLLSQVDLSDVR